MKIVFSTLILSLAVGAFAQDAEKLEDVKQHRLTNIDSRIENLQELKSCVSSATTKDAMKACDQAHKAKRDSMKSANQTWRQGKKAEWKAKKKK